MVKISKTKHITKKGVIKHNPVKKDKVNLRDRLWREHGIYSGCKATRGGSDDSFTFKSCKEFSEQKVLYVLKANLDFGEDYDDKENFHNYVESMKNKKIALQRLFSVVGGQYFKYDKVDTLIKDKRIKVKVEIVEETRTYDYWKEVTAKITLWTV